MSFECVSLQHLPFSDVYRCFRTAFADYVLCVATSTQSSLLHRARKNGWQPHLSVAIVSRNNLVAIMLTGVDSSGPTPRAYDILTGIVPEHRGKGLAGKMLQDF